MDGDRDAGQPNSQVGDSLDLNATKTGRASSRGELALQRAPRAPQQRGEGRELQGMPSDASWEMKEPRSQGRIRSRSP